MATSGEALSIDADVSALEGAVETIGDDTDVGMFTFRDETDWTVALESVTTVDEFAICPQFNWVCW